jgi:hypothetical protein
MRCLAPIVRIRFQDQLDAGLMADEAVRSQADGVIFEFRVSDLLSVPAPP